MMSIVGKKCFVVRPSSVENCYALTRWSCVDVIHYLIKRSAIGVGTITLYQIEDCVDDSSAYETMDKLIAESPFLRDYLPLAEAMQPT